jgi:hypothetical protein
MTCDDPSTDPGEIGVAALFRRDQRSDVADQLADAHRTQPTEDRG